MNITDTRKDIIYSNTIIYKPIDNTKNENSYTIIFKNWDVFFLFY